MLNIFSKIRPGGKSGKNACTDFLWHARVRAVFRLTGRAYMYEVLPLWDENIYLRIYLDVDMHTDLLDHPSSKRRYLSCDYMHFVKEEEEEESKKDDDDNIFFNVSS